MSVLSSPLAVPWQKPFLALVMSCLKVSEDVAKADVLNSLRMQMAQFIACPDSERHSEEEEAALFAFEALRLRLSLVSKGLEMHRSRLVSYHVCFPRWERCLIRCCEIRVSAESGASF